MGGSGTSAAPVLPTEDEILEYAKWLGMDPEEDKDLFYIAKEGLKAPLPKDWKPCKDTAPSSLARGLPPRRSPPQYQRDAVSALNPSCDSSSDAVSSLM